MCNLFRRGSLADHSGLADYHVLYFGRCIFFFFNNELRHCLCVISCNVVLWLINTLDTLQLVLVDYNVRKYAYGSCFYVVIYVCFINSFKALEINLAESMFYKTDCKGRKYKKICTNFLQDYICNIS